jgi:plasmid stabilization system protein ParE
VLSYTEEAAVELEEAADHYEAQVPNLGVRFMAAVAVSEEQIELMPDAGSPVSEPDMPKGIRRVRVKRFPFALVYVVEPELVVVAVEHNRRRPGFWLRRV